MTHYVASNNNIKAMDNSTHSSEEAAASSSAPNGTANNNSGPTTAAASSSGGNTPKRAPNPQQAQLIKLRDANTKYKNLLKLAKERIQEQEGLLDERRCELIFHRGVSCAFLYRICS